MSRRTLVLAALANVPIAIFLLLSVPVHVSQVASGEASTTFVALYVVIDAGLVLSLCLALAGGWRDNATALTAAAMVAVVPAVLLIVGSSGFMVLASMLLDVVVARMLKRPRR